MRAATLKDSNPRRLQGSQRGGGHRQLLKSGTGGDSGSGGNGTAEELPGEGAGPEWLVGDDWVVVYGFENTPCAVSKLGLQECPESECG